MINNSQTIPCPTGCGGQIPFDAQLLLQGSQFTCPNCGAAMGLANESREVVKETIDKFDTMKVDLLKKKEELSNK